MFALLAAILLFDLLDSDEPPEGASTQEIRAWSRGYSCTTDCSGHEAGWNWSEAREISSPENCHGNSASFVEGCEAFAREWQAETMSDVDDNERWEPYLL